MRKATVRSIAAVLVLQTGCYTTRVSTTRTERPTHSDRQWFLLGGLVPLSSPAGSECPQGYSTVESELGGMDVLIGLGLAVAGGLVGGLACGAAYAGNPVTSAASGLGCGSVAAFAVPWMISSRTTSYKCQATSVAPPAPELPPSSPGSTVPAPTSPSSTKP